MTVQQLKQYIFLKNEIKDLDDEIKSLKNAQTTSVVSGSYDVPPYTKHSIKVQGNDEHTKSLIADKRQKRDKLIETQFAVENFVESISDIRIRRIVRMKYLQGLSWNQVAMKLGGYNTSDSVRKACKRFFEKM